MSSAAVMLAVTGALSLFACRPPQPYPTAMVNDFMATCRRDMWPGVDSSEPRVDRFCRCVLERCNRKWDAEKLNRIMVRSASGGWSRGVLGIGSAGRYPSAMQTMMADCKLEGDVQADADH